MNDALKLLKTWASHIKVVYDRRGRATIYSLDSMHTCHGCGYGPMMPHGSGLCDTCREQLHKISDETY